MAHAHVSAARNGGGFMHYRSIYFVVYLAISSLSYYVVTHVDYLLGLVPGYGDLESKYGDIVKNTAAIVVVSGIALLFQASDRICNIIAEKLPFSRMLRRMLSGRDFIEGDWPLVVVYGENSPHPGKLLYHGFLTVEFRGGELYVHGDDWSPDGIHAVSFESVRSSFHADPRERRLQYFYRQGKTWQDASMRGYTEIYFFPTHQASTLHAGQFRDIEHNDVRFYARRKSYRLFAQPLKSPEEKKAAAKEVWTEFEPHIKAMIAQPINADWR